MKLQPAVAVLIPVLLTAACSVQMHAPEEPIEINMNVKIEHEIRVKVERDIEQMLEENKDLF